MDYVRIINPGNTYPTLALSNNDPEFWGANITNNVLPIKDKTYKVIKELDHPSFARTRIMTILDDSYTAFIIGIDGVEESTESAFYGSDDAVSAVPQPIQIRPARRNLVAQQEYNKYEIGDVLIVIDEHSPYYNKRYRVTDLNYSGYDVVTGRNDTATEKSLGFKFHQVKKYIPEPELLPEDKPKFSINEILEVLKQNKTDAEIILDLMDHITN